MNVQEAAYVWSFQLRNSFSDHRAQPGRLLINEETPRFVRQRLESMGYDLMVCEKSSGPITAVFFDRKHGSFWSAASDLGEDYGIAG